MDQNEGGEVEKGGGAGNRVEERVGGFETTATTHPSPPHTIVTPSPPMSQALTKTSNTVAPSPPEKTQKIGSVIGLGGNDPQYFPKPTNHNPDSSQFLPENFSHVAPLSGTVMPPEGAS